MKVVLVLAFASACVSTGTYNRKVEELTKQRDEAAAAATLRERALSGKLADAKRIANENDRLVATLKQRLEQLGQNVDSLLKERGQITQEMADTATRLDELRKQKAAAEARAATFRSLVEKLRSMIDAGQLKVVMRNGRMILALPTDILFDSGRTDIKREGRDALARIAQVLASVADRSYLVAGHTDNVRIHTALFPSNWELSTRRAVEVVHLLVQHGMSPKALAAAGYGEFDPVAANDTAEHRAQNRRIEIVLLPNLSELPPLDESATSSGASASSP